LFGLQARAQDSHFYWTSLVPKNDSRDRDVRSYDAFDTEALVVNMNASEQVFNHHLLWNTIAIADLLPTHTPFCELRFDAVKPLFLTDEEKQILREYFRRGGFVLFQEDAYPYSQDEFWKVKSWPVIDFLTRELPASDKDFTVQKINDSHQLFHQRYETKTSEMTRHELEGNPYSPNRTLVSYRGHACAFVYGRYNLVEDGKWAAMEQPYEHIFSLDAKGYKLSVNIYVYAAMH
jgi:hypothetical protein